MKRGIDNFSFPASLVLSLFGFCCLLLPFDIHFLEPGFTLFYSTLEYDSLVLFYAVFIGLCACLAISLAGMKVPSFTLKIALLIVDIVSLVFLAGYGSRDTGCEMRGPVCFPAPYSPFRQV